MIEFTLYFLMPVGLLVLLAYLGWWIDPAPTRGRRSSRWERWHLIA